MPKTWPCPSCGFASVPAAAYCQRCNAPRYASWAIMVAEHVLEHLADGLSEPLDVLKAMQERGIYKHSLTLAFIAQQMRLLTRDTTTLARQIAKARASRLMLEVTETGSNAEKLQVLKGVQVLGDVVEHKIDAVTRFVVETHDGPPPKPEPPPSE